MPASEANVEDACAFAWLQLVRYRPQRDSQKTTVFGWLLKAAVREAIKLDRRARRWADLELLAEAPAASSRETGPADIDGRTAGLAHDPQQSLDDRSELLASIQIMAAAGLRRREKRALILRAMGYTRREMVALTGDSCRTVDRQLARARRKLRGAANGSAARGLDS